MYSHIFDAGLEEKDLSFDRLIMEVTEENKAMIVPILLRMIEENEQRVRLEQLCERIRFDLAAVERGIGPSPKGTA